MNSILYKFLCLWLFAISAVWAKDMDFSSNQDTDWNKVSEVFLNNIRDGKSTADIRTQLYNTTLQRLESSLDTDRKKLAFWINIYNAYIQEILSKNPEKYQDRSNFFKAEQIPIAGRMLSFEKIEHGIIRKSQWPLGLGLVRKWFPNKFERKLRVDKRDFRIHFALNCGAKDCPPVAIYRAVDLEKQLAKGTENYLTKTSEYNGTTNEVRVTPLFSWFRGDFGCKRGIKKILREHKVIPRTENIDLIYKNYDWTLDLDNWTKL